MNSKQLVLALGAAASVLFVSSAQAEVVTNILTTAGSSQRAAFTNALYWADAQGVANPSGPIDSAVDYLVYGKQLSVVNAASGTWRFGGRSLTIGLFGQSDGNLGFYPYKNARVIIDNLTLARGTMTFQMCDSTRVVHGYLDGDCTIGPQQSGKYFGIRGDYSNQVFHLDAPLHGTRDSRLKIFNSIGTKSAMDFLTVLFTSTASDFDGSVLLQTGLGSAPGAKPNVTLALSTAPVGAVTLQCATGLASCQTNVVTVGDLELQDGAVLIVDGSSVKAGETWQTARTSFVVTNALTLAAEAQVYVRMPAKPFASDGVAHDVPILTVPYGTGLQDERFTLVAAEGAIWGDPELTVVTDTENGTETLVMRVSPVVELIETDSANNGFNNYTSALQNPSQWSDGVGPAAGKFLYVDTYNGAVMSLRMPAVQGSTAVEIPCRCLTIGQKSTFTLFQPPVNIACLRLADGAILQNGQWCSPSTIQGGTVEFFGGTVVLKTFNTHVFKINSEMKGSACLRTQGPDSSSSPSGNLEINGANPNFTGTYTVTSYLNPKEIADVRYQSLSFASSASVGGNLSAFDAKALVLERLGMLKQKTSVAFTDPNRGLYIGDRAQIEVAEGQTVSFAGATTFHGRLYKSGSGCLAFGGTAQFDSAEGIVATPQADSNLLSVVAGEIKPQTATCLDGVAIDFADGTALRIDADATDATLRAQGLRNVKAATPITLGTENLHIGISRAGASPLKGALAQDLGLLTVTEDVAKTLRGKIDVSLATGTFAGKRTVTLVETADATAKTVTFAAHIEGGNGLLLLVK